MAGFLRILLLWQPFPYWKFETLHKYCSVWDTWWILAAIRFKEQIFATASTGYSYNNAIEGEVLLKLRALLKGNFTTLNCDLIVVAWLGHLLVLCVGHHQRLWDMFNISPLFLSFAKEKGLDHRPPYRNAHKKWEGREERLKGRERIRDRGRTTERSEKSELQ